MAFPLRGYLLHCTILIAYLGLSKEKLLQSNIYVAARRSHALEKSPNTFHLWGFRLRLPAFCLPAKSPDAERIGFAKKIKRDYFSNS
jgi:hypothetical protein